MFEYKGDVKVVQSGQREVSDGSGRGTKVTKMLLDIEPVTPKWSGRFPRASANLTPRWALWLDVDDKRIDSFPRTGAVYVELDLWHGKERVEAYDDGRGNKSKGGSFDRVYIDLIAVGSGASKREVAKV